MLTARVDLAGLHNLRDGVVRDLTVGLQTAVYDAGNATVQQAKGTTQFKDGTGRLRESILLDSVRTVFGRRAEAIVRASTAYAWFVHAGTKAHEIWPRAMHGFKGPLRKGQSRRARGEGKGGPEFAKGLGLALRWEDAGGEEHFARMVHHPGTAPRPFLTDRLPFAAAFLRRRLQQLGETVAARWSR